MLMQRTISICTDMIDTIQAKKTLKLAQGDQPRKSVLSSFRLRPQAFILMCQLSLRQFERKFKSYFNLSPTQYIMKMRIHEACDLLCNGSRPIGDIAFALGFYDQSSFTVQFKKTMSMTPLQYRKQFL